MTKLSVNTVGAVIALVVATVLIPSVGRAETVVPTALQCTFTQGASHALTKGIFKGEPAGNLTLDLTNIDIEKQSAVLRTANGATNVRLVRAINAFHVIEVVTEGFLNLTTIYDRDDALGGMPAAHSRHFGLLGQPVVSQYFGTCKAK